MRCPRFFSGFLLIAYAGVSLHAVAQDRADGDPQASIVRATSGHSTAVGFPEQLEQALAMLQSSAAIDAEPALAAVLAEPAFKRLPKARRYEVLIAAGHNAWRAGKLEVGRARLTRAVDLDSDQPNAWYLLALIEAQLGEGEKTAEHLTHLATTWPDLVNHVEARQLGYVLFALEPRSDMRANLLQAFFDAGWSRSPASASNFWFQLSLLRLDRGEVDAARRVAVRVNHPSDVVSMRMDKRFMPLISGQEEAWDPLEKGTQLLAVLRARAAAAPSDLEVQTELLEAMLVIGLHQEVLDLSDRILSAIDAGDSAYQGATMQNWIANHRALAFLRLNRVDDGLAQMVLASGISEEGQAGNTSQVLNLAQLYGRLDRPAEALLTLSRVAQMSDYGRMVEASVRHAASIRRGDVEASAEALEFLREHRTKAPDRYLDALLFADMEDAAALAVVELLRSEDERSTALRWLQDLKQPPELKGEAHLRDRWLRLRQREDVRAEAAKWGSMGTYPIYGS